MTDEIYETRWASVYGTVILRCHEGTCWLGLHSRKAVARNPEVEIQITEGIKASLAEALLSSQQPQIHDAPQPQDTVRDDDGRDCLSMVGDSCPDWLIGTDNKR